MKRAGQIALMPFPYTNLQHGFLRELPESRLLDIKERLAVWLTSRNGQ
ncbi:hypothetical protein [Halomonas sp. PR-M31]|nr:hypothetical protein [Halomonas sp. PR-M31]